MDKSKKEKLKNRGWKVGSAQDFLGLSDEEVAYIELKLALSQSLKERRQKKRITQTELARLLESSQSRIAKMEAGDPSVSVDLLVRAHFMLGVTRKDLVKSLSGPVALREKLAS